MAVVEMFGAEWCGDCIRSKRFLDEHQVEYSYRNIETDPALAEQVIQYNLEAGHGPKRRIPVILVDGRILSEPTDAELAAALGLSA